MRSLGPLAETVHDPLLAPEVELQALLDERAVAFDRVPVAGQEGFEVERRRLAERIDVEGKGRVSHSWVGGPVERLVDDRVGGNVPDQVVAEQGEARFLVDEDQIGWAMAGPLEHDELDPPARTMSPSPTGRSRVTLVT